MFSTFVFHGIACCDAPFISVILFGLTLPNFVPNLRFARLPLRWRGSGATLQIQTVHLPHVLHISIHHFRKAFILSCTPKSEACVWMASPNGGGREGAARAVCCKSSANWRRDLEGPPQYTSFSNLPSFFNCSKYFLASSVVFFPCSLNYLQQCIFNIFTHRVFGATDKYRCASIDPLI